MKKIVSLLPILVLLLTLNLSVFAASLSLTKIGALDTSGNTYPHWWYTGTSPTLSGTATANKEVKVSVDGQSQSATADGSGNWSTAINTTAGDHQIVITSEGETYSFTLTTGSDVPSDIGTTTTTTTTPQSTASVAVPDTGSNQVLAIVLSTTLMVAGYYYFKIGNKRALKKFEESF